MGKNPADHPRIAVVIPTYNRADVLPRAIDSVLRSRRADVEVAVIDDASTDGTQTVLERYRDPRLTVRRLAERGNGNVARNEGIRATSAPVVAFLDSDDEFLEGRLERLVGHFDAHPDHDAVADSFLTEKSGEIRAARIPDIVVGREEIERLLVTHAIPLTTSSICVRRGAIEEIGGFDEQLPRQQDRDILLRLARVTPIALGTGEDVVKHQTVRSVSRSAAGYVEGLDSLVARHPVFRRTEYRDMLAYLAVRTVLKSLFAGQIGLALTEAAALGKAENLSVSLSSAIARYPQGKYLRRNAVNDLHLKSASRADAPKAPETLAS